MTFGQRKIALIVAIALAPLAVFGLILYQGVKEEIDSLFKTQMTSAINNLRSEIELSRRLTETVIRRMDEKNLSLARALAEIVDLRSRAVLSVSEMTRLARLLGVTETCVIDADGIIKWSSQPAYLDYVMASDPQSAPFDAILADRKLEIVQEPMPNGSLGEPFQYVGVSLPRSEGYAQLGFKAEIPLELADLQNIQRRVAISQIGRGGFAAILRDGVCVASRESAQIGGDFSDQSWSATVASGEGFAWISYGGEEYLAGYANYEGQTILTLLPAAEYYQEIGAVRGALAVCGGAAALALALVLALSVRSFVLRPTGEALARLQDAKRRADAESRGKSSFLARVSHEIRTPLNAIVGMSELAARDFGKPEGRARLADARAASASLLSVMNDIIDFARLAEGEMKIARAPYESASLFADLGAIARVGAGEEGARLEMEIDPLIPRSLVGDAPRVRRALSEALASAMKSAPQGRVLFQARAEMGPDGQEALLTFNVEDDGPDKGAEDLDGLWGEGEGDKPGAGLGLPVARGLCRAMGGDLRRARAPGGGSRWEASIRQEIGDARPLGPFDPLAVARAAPESARFTAPGFRVLVVDDVASNLLVAEGLLAPYRFKVESCASGEEALRLARANSYDLIFMDHMMDGMDGVETVAAIRALGGSRARLPIAALTANAVAGTREMFLASGFDDFLAKPIEIAKLAALLERHVPRERRAAAAAPAPAPEGAPFESLAEALARVEGLNSVTGLALSGGAWERYRKVLELCLQEIEARLGFLGGAEAVREPGAARARAHALKSALANIGAGALAREAAALEEAAAGGEGETLAARAESFRASLGELARALTAALARSGAPERPARAGNGDGAEAQATIERLLEALAREDIGTVDGCLARLEGFALEENDALSLARVADFALTSEFQKAARETEALLKRQRGERDPNRDGA